MRHVCASYNAHTYIVEQLCQLCDCLLDVFDVPMTLLHIAIGRPCITIPIRVHQSLAKDLTTLVILHDCLDFLSCRVGSHCDQV